MKRLIGLALLMAFVGGIAGCSDDKKAVTPKGTYSLPPPPSAAGAGGEGGSGGASAAK